MSEKEELDLRKSFGAMYGESSRMISEIWRTRMEESRRAAIMRSPETRDKVTVSVFSDESYSHSGSISEYVSWLNGLLAGIPEEWRANADIRISSSYEHGESYTTCDVTYWRWETDDEMNPRLAERTKLLADMAAAKDAKERKEFEALKAKFG